MSTKIVSVPETSLPGKPAAHKLKRFPAKAPKAPVDPRAVAEDTLKRYPKTMARLAE